LLPLNPQVSTQVLPDRHGVAPTRRASSLASRKSALAQTDRLWLGCGPRALNSAPKSVITSWLVFE